jgi:hypothetical protein
LVRGEVKQNENPTRKNEGGNKDLKKPRKQSQAAIYLNQTTYAVPEDPQHPPDSI